MNSVPGMYENRPERFFDDPNDQRNRREEVQDSQHTRDVQIGSSLIDLMSDPGEFLFCAMCLGWVRLEKDEAVL